MEYRRDVATRAHTVPKFLLRGFAAPTPVNHEPFVWVASLKTGELVRRSPKNISIARGFYDGPGGFSDSNASIEAHLAKIESEAAAALKRMVAQGDQPAFVPPEIWRFVSWQAARSPGWLDVEQQLANERWDGTVVEPPPAGFEKIASRTRSLLLEAPDGTESREVNSEDEFHRLRGLGWKWILRRDDRLEAMHVQAWYFQVRHFPRLDWVQLTAPAGECFITSDRGAAWLVEGYADTPPAALRDPNAQVVAPLTASLALIGRHGNRPLNVTSREVNRFVAFASNDWIAGPDRAVLEQALADRRYATQ
jgi:hypothetical protein